MAQRGAEELSPYALMPKGNKGSAAHRRGRPMCLPRYMPHATFGHPLVGAHTRKASQTAIGQPQGVAPTVDVLRFFALLKMIKYALNFEP